MADTTHHSLFNITSEPIQDNITFAATSGLMENITIDSEFTNDNQSSIGRAYTIIFTIINSVVICLGTCGSICVIISIKAFRKLQSNHNLYLISLAFADLLIAAFVYPLHAATAYLNYWPFGGKVCQAWFLVDSLASTISVWNLVAIAINRYFAVADPLHYSSKQTTKKVICTIILVWTLPPLFTIICLMAWHKSVNPMSGVLSMTTNKCVISYGNSLSIVGLLLTLAYFIAPIASLIFLYSRIYFIARDHIQNHLKRTFVNIDTTVCTNRHCHDHSNHKHEKAKGNKIETYKVKTESMSLNTSKNISSINVTENENKVLHNNPGNETVSMNLNARTQQKIHTIKCICERREKKMLCMTVTIVCLFLICWLPLVTYMTVNNACEGCSSFESEELLNFLSILAYGNSAVNPIIYTIFNRDFRVAFKSILTFKICFNYKNTLQ